MVDSRILEGLRASQLAVELDAGDLEVLSGEMSLRELTEGEVLVPEGTIDSHLYIVVAGALGVVKGLGTPQEEQLTAIRPGNLVGELAFIDGAVRYASLVALHASQVLSLDRARLEGLIDEHPHLVYHVMRGIVRVVHEIQRRQSVESSELTNYLYKTHGRY
ncbi:MAG TPA: cyclic nucleotide-binding domain-containing protein [Steroidobacteraceae bacterium]|nr:cyclic nucleotide-binding domain-containing protein [Steroidobacteraceae bacterium]